jgi:hypothetical protein
VGLALSDVKCMQSQTKMELLPWIAASALDAGFASRVAPMGLPSYSGSQILRSEILLPTTRHGNKSVYVTGD